MVFNAEKVIRFALGQGGRLFPGLAGRLAFDVFCRTNDPAKPGKGEARAIERSAAFMQAAHTIRLQVSQGWVAVHWFAARAPVRGRALVLHGWASRTDYMVSIIEHLVRDGWAVAALDLPGHGQSSGRSLNVKLGVEAVAIVNEALGPFNYAIGHSFGGVVAVNAAVGGIRGFEPVPFPQLATIASPNSMPDLFRSVGKRLGLGKQAQAAFEERVHKVAGYPLDSYVMTEQLKRYGGTAVIVHAPDDREVAFSDAEEMAKAGDHVSLLATPGLGHRRIISSALVCEALCNFGKEMSAIRIAA